jgi:exopolysaccharide biosynthesis protein
VLAALLLGIFYVTNYEMHTEVKPVASLPVPSWFADATHGAVTADPSSPAETSGGTAPPATAGPGDWRAKFPDKFTDGAVEQTDNSYKSANISISIEKVQKESLTYFVVNIYIAELKYFKTAFAKKADTMGGEEHTNVIAKENNAILAINGDFCLRNEGIVVRNGQMYPVPRSSLDSFVMYYDGTMKGFSPDEFDADKIKSEGAYQVWTFGPMLVKDGQPMTEFNSNVTNRPNPRTALGYYEPGHYCFVVVDGMQGSYSEGISLPALSQILSGLGCKEAFNLDGGHTSEMVYMGEFVNQPLGGGRVCSDIVYIAGE